MSHPNNTNRSRFFGSNYVTKTLDRAVDYQVIDKETLEKKPDCRFRRRFYNIVWSLLDGNVVIYERTQSDKPRVLVSIFGLEDAVEQFHRELDKRRLEGISNKSS